MDVASKGVKIARENGNQLKRVKKLLAEYPEPSAERDNLLYIAKRLKEIRDTMILSPFDGR